MIELIDHSTMWGDEPSAFKLISTDLNGQNYEELIIPKAHLDDRARYEQYYMSFIYNDFIYFNSLEYSDPKIDVFKIRLDGSDIQYTNVLGEPLGAFEDMIYYTNSKSTDISKDNIDYDTNDDNVFLYESIGSDINYDIAYYNTFMDRNHIIITYRWDKDKFHNIVVLDLDGNVITEKSIPIGNESDYNRYNITASVIGDYVYYKYNKNYTFDGLNESINRFKLLD